MFFDAGMCVMLAIAGVCLRGQQAPQQCVPTNNQNVYSLATHGRYPTQTPVHVCIVSRLGITEEL